MNRFKLLKVQELYNYANCSHAIRADLNAIYKFYMIHQKLTGYAGDYFELMEEVRIGMGSATANQLIGLLNIDARPSDYFENAGDKQFYKKFVKYMKENYTFSGVDVDVFLEEVVSSVW